MILEFVFEVDIIWTHFLHILDNVNGNHSFTLFPFYLINIFITKLLEKTVRKGCFFIAFKEFKNIRRLNSVFFIEEIFVV